MDAVLLLKSMTIGVAVAVPMGPLSVLLIRRALVRGYGSSLIDARQSGP